MSVVVTDDYRVPITASKDDHGGVTLRHPRTFMRFNQAEFDRLVAYVRDEPIKARMQVYKFDKPA